MARREATRATIGSFLRELGKRFAFDPLSTALAKIERGQERDIDDVRALVHSGAVTLQQIVAGFNEIAPRIEREALPRVREDDFRRKIDAVVQLLSAGPATQGNEPGDHHSSLR
jgi:hypothetical protein